MPNPWCPATPSVAILGTDDTKMYCTKILQGIASQRLTNVAGLVWGPRRSREGYGESSGWGASPSFFGGLKSSAPTSPDNRLGLSTKASCALVEYSRERRVRL